MYPYAHQSCHYYWLIPFDLISIFTVYAIIFGIVVCLFILAIRVFT